MSLFGITAADLQKKIQPVNDEQTFSIGASGDLSEDDADEIIAIAEDRVLMRLKPRYRQLCRRVDGEVLIRRAAGGEVTATTGLKPITTGTLTVWKNVENASMWAARDRREALVLTTDYTANLTTGVITLSTALIAGDSLWAEYDHTGAATLTGLRDIALTLAAVEVSRRFAFFRSADGVDPFTQWEQTAYGDLNRMEGVDGLDRLDLVWGETEPQRFYDSILNISSSV